ncbi:hypothetical protein [Photobacterium kishitanii]|uniref:Uncharacterized protein n=1 Tax=Photobacterium kishitanii TaxID=318456 RepID=A0A2T3KL02_9GAMM|nr:hypothetical protein [Photobacterium kishitanii]PSV00371.1 hypothetical protein C9J27_04385 [Photobacterium kishitanii]
MKLYHITFNELLMEVVVALNNAGGYNNIIMPLQKDEDYDDEGSNLFDQCLENIKVNNEIQKVELSAYDITCHRKDLCAEDISPDVVLSVLNDKLRKHGNVSMLLPTEKHHFQCHQCGGDFLIDTNGIASHETNGLTDGHDLDSDHVPFDPQLAF